MKQKEQTTAKRFLSIALAAIALTLAGCSSGEKQIDPATPQFSEKGPTIINVTSVPGLVELDENYQPLQPAEIVADIKDFRHDVTDVRLKFRDVPLEVPMIKMNGTTWRAELSPSQLQQLAVGGKTVRYSADVLAWNDTGEGNQSEKPITLSVKSPEYTAG
jgi:hypothetical protein